MQLSLCSAPISKRTLNLSFLGLEAKVALKKILCIAKTCITTVVKEFPFKSKEYAFESFFIDTVEWVDRNMWILVQRTTFVVSACFGFPVDDRNKYLLQYISLSVKKGH